MPAGHALQYLAPLYTPEPSLSLLVEVEKDPAPQVMQLEDVPELGWYFPPWHSWQLLPLLYSPAAQIMKVQVLEPGWEVLPVAQLAQLLYSICTCG